MVCLALELNVTFLDDGVALVADVFSHSGSLLFRVTLPTEGAVGVSHEAGVGEHDAAQFALKTLRMPVVVHGLDHPSDDEIIATSATRSKQNVEIVFAILASLKFVKYSFGKRLEALSTDETLGVPYFATRVHYLFMDSESFSATCARCVA